MGCMSFSGLKPQSAPLRLIRFGHAELVLLVGLVDVGCPFLPSGNRLGCRLITRTA